MKTISLKLKASLLALTAVIVTACGGGSGTTVEPVVAGTDVPVTATETTAAVISFANLSVSKGTDGDEPLQVGEAALASSETDEPDPSV
jgi:hypothetical protein